MEQRWGFLAPWTEVLRTRIKYRWPEADEGIWAFKRRFLEVYPLHGSRTATKSEPSLKQRKKIFNARSRNSEKPWLCWRLWRTWTNPCGDIGWSTSVEWTSEWKEKKFMKKKSLYYSSFT